MIIKRMALLVGKRSGLLREGAGSDRPEKRARLVDGRIIYTDTEQGDPAFERFREAKTEAPGGGGGPPTARVFNADETLLTPELRKYMKSAGGVIQSNGRGQPTYPLGRVHEVVVADPQLFDKRQRLLPGDAVAPLGPRSAFSWQPGALLWEDAAGNTGFRSNSTKATTGTIAGFGDRVVCACVNGLPRTAILRFVGSALTAHTATDPIDDVAQTVATVGMVTTVNTGPVTLLPGRTAGYLMTPMMVTINGHLKPGIAEVGIDPDCFRPMLIMIDDLLSPAILLRAMEEARAAVDIMDVALLTVSEFSRHWSQRRQRLRSVVVDVPLTRLGSTGMVQDVLWLDLYLAWVMVQMAVGNGWRDIQANECNSLCQELENVHWKLVNVEAVMDRDPKVHGPQAIATLDKDEFAQHGSRRVIGAGINHTKQIAARAIGKITTLSPPGAPVDLNLGHFTS